MYCPRCGSSQREDLKFCTACGSNLQAVLKVMDSKDSSENIDWRKTWVGEMFLSESERKLRQEELERKRGITPEIKRYNEIKAGVIVGSVGIAVTIFLYFLMQGIINGGKVPNDTAEILSRVWIAGVIPLFIGFALLMNGLFISKKMVEIAKGNERSSLKLPNGDKQFSELGPADTKEFIQANPSVTEQTTRHLNSPFEKEN